MEKKLLHTPEGVRDIYDKECSRMLCLQNVLQEKFRHFGFRDIKTPTIEYFDIFSKEVGTIPSSDLYKFFDREGNTLVLRPDYTPSIARCAAKYYMEEELPLRFCYSGNVFINESGMYQGRLKETTQLGAEMIGDTTVDADVEMIALVIRLLKEAGLENFQVEIGQVDFFKGLLQETDMDEDTVAELRELISNKNLFGLEELLSNHSMSTELKQVFLKLPELFGSIEILEEAESLTNNERALAAIHRLKNIYGLLSIYHLENYITFDLGMLSKYNYYTGIIYKAYTLGTGEAIVTGGRYDNLLGLFGKESPAIGFTLLLDLLITALSRQGIELEAPKAGSICLFDTEDRKQAMTAADMKRNAGEAIELICRDADRSLEEYVEYARRKDVSVLSYYHNHKVELIETKAADCEKN